MSDSLDTGGSSDFGPLDGWNLGGIDNGLVEACFVGIVPVNTGAGVLSFWHSERLLVINNDFS
jgi:hypothetical protein